MTSGSFYSRSDATYLFANSLEADMIVY